MEYEVFPILLTDAFPDVLGLLLRSWGVSKTPKCFVRTYFSTACFSPTPNFALSHLIFKTICSCMRLMPIDIKASPEKQYNTVKPSLENFPAKSSSSYFLKSKGKTTSKTRFYNLPAATKVFCARCKKRPNTSPDLRPDLRPVKGFCLNYEISNESRFQT